MSINAENVGVGRESIGYQKGLFTAKEVADILSISLRTLDKEIAEGRITPVRIRSSRRFTPGEIEKYIAAREVDSAINI